jgi:Icc protein
VAPGRRRPRRPAAYPGVAVLGAQLGPATDGPARPAVGDTPTLVTQVADRGPLGSPDVTEWELTSVSDDGAVFFRGTEVDEVGDLEPGAPHEVHGISFTTLARPAGARLATVATVNDVHFGETEAGRVEGSEVGPVLSSPAGAEPYPEVMNRAAAAEIAALQPDAVLAKGDITARGLAEEYRAFEACYRPLFGDRLHVTRGNHDNGADRSAFQCPDVQRIDVPGAVLALLDTSLPGRTGGGLSAQQLDWLDDLAADASAPVLAFGHHPCWEDIDDWLGEGPALDPASSAALVDVVARRRRIVGWFAGHTHRNKVRRFAATGDVPYVEVACAKDFPGSWAEYRIFEGGILQVHHRIAAPEALAWSEHCRALVFGLYPHYAFGNLGDRCLALPPPGG